MKRYIIYIAMSAALMLTAIQADAQVGKRWYIDAGWQFNATLSNPVAKSAQGWGAYMEGGYYVTPMLALGGFVSYNTNNQYFPKHTFQYGDGSALTTDFDRSLYQIPFGATLRYRFMRNKVQPYIQAKLGANYSEQSTYMSTFRIAHDSWGFYASPEIGVTIHPFNRTNFGFQIAAYYSFATNRSKYYGMNGINNLGFKLGLSF